MRYQLSFDPTINLGNLLTAIAILLAAGGLYYQARSVIVAERTLTAKVAEVGELAKSLERERLERLSGVAEQTQFSNKLLGLQAALDQDLSVRYNDYIWSLSLSSLTLSMVMDSNSGISASQKTLYLQHVRDLQAGLRDLIALSSAHSQRLRRLGAESQGLTADALRESLAKANKEFEAAVEAPASRYRSARDSLAKALTTRQVRP